MGAADDLWDAVVVTYDEDGLIALTNVRDYVLKFQKP